MIKITHSKYKGNIVPPSSKSDAHRALICASLCSRPTNIYNIDLSDDIKATISSLESLGARFEVTNKVIKVFPLVNKVNTAILDVNESGSTLRFLIPLTLVYSNKSIINVKGNLINRPLDSYNEAFSDQDIKIIKKETYYQVSGELKPGTFTLEGNVSSQFISGLLFSLPLLKGDSKIIIKNKISSLNYILMTIETLKKYNIKIDFDIEKQTINVPGNQLYETSFYVVENDYSQASFYIGLGLIHGDISIKGLNLNSYQPDKNILSIVEKMNGKLEIKIDEINVFKSNLVGTTISLDENPDLGPILFGLAAFTSTPTKFTNIKRLRIKESNRIDSMIYNLKLLGIKVEEIDEDNLIIYPGTITKPKETLKSFHDHRIFMTLCIITSLLDEVTIDDETCINKSYPNFLYDLNSLKDGD